ncbi:hypothetical protein, partial [Stenotrophomonas maltophilia]|uniref:hypothetical protein n=1 Tax=Stenotrophomonas maltophilia TaxID=40324 RepID=UPI0019D40A95
MATNRPRGAAGSASCRFVIGVTIKPPWRQDQVARLQILLQPTFQPLLMRADRAVSSLDARQETALGL